MKYFITTVGSAMMALKAEYATVPVYNNWVFENVQPSLKMTYKFGRMRPVSVYPRSANQQPSSVCSLSGRLPGLLRDNIMAGQCR